MTRDGTLETHGGRQVLRFERRLGHPIEKVWAALTEPAELIGWLAEAEVELEEGGRVVLRWQNTDEEGNRAVMHATITRLDPPRLIEYEGDVHGLLRWELREEGERLRPRLHERDAGAGGVPDQGPGRLAHPPGPPPGGAGR